MTATLKKISGSARPRPGPNDKIHFHTPGRFASLWPYRVLGVGETHFERGRTPISYRFHIHTLIYTLKGCGLIDIEGQVSKAEPGAIVWLDTSTTYSHRCHPAHASWDYIWFSISGYELDALFSHWKVGSNPLFYTEGAEEIFSTVLANLSQEEGANDALSSKCVARILELMAAEREARVRESFVGGRLQKVMDVMRANPQRQWVIAELAEIADLSASQLFRQFRRKTATTPLDWLRHERISLAKRALVETDALVREIAESYGYPDPYHFSRDFTRIVGSSPSAFRAANLGLTI